MIQELSATQHKQNHLAVNLQVYSYVLNLRVRVKRYPVQYILGKPYPVYVYPLAAEN